MGNTSGLKTSLIVLLVLSTSLNIFGVDMKTSQFIDKKIQEIFPDMVKIRRYLHMNPELGNREFETAKLIASRLNTLGFEVKTGIAKTGVVGLLRGQQSRFTLAIRADMDALPIQEITELPYKSLNPGIMHACGHDIHTTIALGTAHVMNSLRDTIKGNIKFIFQPAEEGPPEGEEGGASLMIKEGVLEDPPVGAIFGLHVWPEFNVGEIGFSSGTIMANADLFQIIIHGKTSHGARPHEGIDAIVLASQCVVALQSVISRAIDATDPAVLTLGKIEGGSRDNILAEKVTIEGTLRTLSEKNRKKIPKLMEDVVKGTAQSFGADYTFIFREGTPAVVNYPDLANLLRPTLAKVLGEKQVKELKPQMVAEDFSFYSQKIPGFFFFLGVKSPGLKTSPPLHTPYFNPDENSISVGIKIMSHLLLDFLENQGLLDN